MLTYAHVCSRVLTYAHVCWCMLTQVEKRGSSSSKNTAEKGKTKQAVALLAHKRFMEQVC